ncbi:hypothetical protein SOVF_087990 [Spinacia oleracea]|uniref:EGF-like domain-containing protein n=1 Tax=Spinacia oleracea TaxID=3562 RepID=A0A9R0JBF6_SPIOL|nr:uncharacterized protein LOC110803711 [Spinacia oleracea]KNA16497.1 hypothetical protein SOVF_087990 [Spinacia oleracea]
MAFSSTLIFAVFAIFITILQPPLINTEPDFLAPIIGSLCNRVGCGKGKCKMSGNNDFEYECECEPGWRQTISTNSSSSDFKFLPCVIPNCTLKYSCSETAPSPQSMETPSSNASTFEPCRMANCGGGVCKKASGLTYTCQCKEGYSNLFNNTGFPCLNECSIGGDCPNLGLAMSNRSTTTPPTVADSRGSNQACSQKHGVLSHPMILLAISIAALAL